MSEEFNPYGQWLGLPPERNRPNHYELLGLPIRESDSKAIGLAAEQAATRVRSFRPGEHAVDWARLLDEIQAAKLTLLDPLRKAEYDEQFSASGRSSTTSSQASRPQVVESTPHAGRGTFTDLYPPGFRPHGEPPEKQPESEPARPATAPATEQPVPVMPPWSQSAPQVQSVPAMPAPAAYPAAVAAAVPAAYPSGWPPTGYSPGAVAAVAQPVGTTAMFPSGYAAAMAPAAVPVALPTSAAPNPMSGYLPQPYAVAMAAVPLAVAAPIDPMAPVAIPGMSAVPTPTPVAAAMPMSVAAVPAAATPTPSSPGFDASPQVCKASAAAVMMAAHKEKQTRNAALLAGAAAGLVVVAGLGAYAVFASRMNTPDDRRQVAQADALPQKHEDKSESQPAVKPPRPAGENSETTDSEPPSQADEGKVEPMPPSPPPMPAPAPESKPEPLPTPTPTPTPTPEPKPEPAPAPSAKPTRQQVVALEAALKRAKVSLSEQSFDEAEAEAAKAEKAAVTPDHQALVARLRLAIDHVKLFRQALAEATSKLEAAETIKVGSSTVVAIVDTFPDKITIRINGMNRTYSFENIPPGLAAAILDVKRIGGQPDSRVLKAMFVATGKNADDEAIAEARGWLGQVEASDSNVGELLKYLDDSYDGLVQAFDEAEKSAAAN